MSNQQVLIFPKYENHKAEFNIFAENTESVIEQLSIRNADIYKVNLENNKSLDRFDKKIIYPIGSNEKYKSYVRFGYYESN